MSSDQDLTHSLPNFLKVGTIIDDRYLADEVVGTGGMGWVLKARDSFSNNQACALKVVYPHLVNNESGQQRLRREALVTMRLSHPNLVQTFGIGRLLDITTFLVMEFVDGQSLRAHIESQSLDADFKLHCVIAIAQALHYAHEVGVIHRDLKPDNILISKERQVKVADFGIASILRDEESSEGVGELLGTPLYMSPEQFLGTPLDARSDIYSFGILIYELFCDTPPFTNSSFVLLAQEHCHKAIPHRVIHTQAPEWIASLVIKCCQKQPDERFQSMFEVLRHIQSHTGDLLHESGSIVVVPNLREDEVNIDNMFWRKVQTRALAIIVASSMLLLYAVINAVGTLPHLNAYVNGKILTYEQQLNHRFVILRWMGSIHVDKISPSYFFRNNLAELHVRAMIHAGLDPNRIVNADGLTPLQFWITQTDHYESDEIVSALLEFGAQPDVKSIDGRSAAEFAVRADNYNALKKLFSYGLDLNLETNKRQSLLALARKLKHQRIEELLLQEGATTNR